MRVKCHGLGALLLILLAVNGCAVVKSTKPPSGYARVVEKSVIADPEARAEAYRRLFPAQPKLQMGNATLKLIQNWAPDSFPLLMNYAALEPGTVRMIVFQPNLNAPFFDLTLVGQFMTATFPAEREAYVGSVADEGSPFARALGVEPGDIWRVYEIAHRVSEGAWRQKRRWGSIVLLPVAPAADGLEWVRLDRKTGLPSAARWERGDRAWTVHFKAWEYYADPGVAQGGSLFLMPRLMDVRSSDPKVTLRLEIKDQGRYVFGAQSSPALFRPPDLSNYRVYPLEGIGAALDRKMRELARQ